MNRCRPLSEPGSLSGFGSETRQEFRQPAENAAETLDEFRYKRIPGQRPTRMDCDLIDHVHPLWAHLHSPLEISISIR